MTILWSTEFQDRFDSFDAVVDNVSAHGGYWDVQQENPSGMRHSQCQWSTCLRYVGGDDYVAREGTATVDMAARGIAPEVGEWRWSRVWIGYRGYVIDLNNPFGGTDPDPTNPDSYDVAVFLLPKSGGGFLRFGIVLDTQPISGGFQSFAASIPAEDGSAGPEIGTPNSWVFTFGNSTPYEVGVMVDATSVWGRFRYNIKPVANFDWRVTFANLGYSVGPATHWQIGQSGLMKRRNEGVAYNAAAIGDARIGHRCVRGTDQPEIPLISTNVVKKVRPGGR